MKALSLIRCCSQRARVPLRIPVQVPCHVRRSVPAYTRVLRRGRLHSDIYLALCFLFGDACCTLCLLCAIAPPHCLLQTDTQTHIPCLAG
jgi:hypothetical protein